MPNSKHEVAITNYTDNSIHRLTKNRSSKACISTERGKVATLAESYAKNVKSKPHETEDRIRISPPTKTKRTHSRSNDRKDQSPLSALSKDDVMPCLKYRVEG